MIDTPTPDSPQPHNDQEEHPDRGRVQSVAPRPPTEVSNLRPDMLPLATVHPREIKQQQIELTPEEQVQVDKRQAVTTMAGGATVAGIGDILSTALRYLGIVTMTHILSQSSYGIFVAVLTPVAIVGLLASMGLDVATLRFLSTYRAKGERGLAAGLIRFAVWATLISGLLCGAVFFLSAGALAHFVYRSSVYELPFKEMALLIPLIALQLVFADGLQALKAIKWKVYVDRLIQPGLTLIMMGVFYLLGLRLGGMILATICGFLAATIMGQLLLRKAARQFVLYTVPKFAPRAWLRFALPMCFYSIIQNILSSIDVLSLAIFATPAQIGLYAVADRMSLLVLMPFTALSTIFSPMIAEYYESGDREQLANMLKLVTKWSFSLSLPVFLCFCVFHNAVLGVFSSEYKAGGIVLIIVSFGYLVFAVAGPSGLLLLMLGRTRLFLTSVVVSIAINVTLAFLLVPRFNIVGAAVSVTVSLIMGNVVGLVAVYWITKMHAFRWDMLKPMRAGGVAAGVSFLLLHVLHLPDGRLGTVEALGLIIPFVLIYVLVLALLRFSEEDMMVFDAIRTKLGSLARHKG